MAETRFIKTKKDRNYSVISNTFLRDDTLSLKAKGLFSYLLYLPEDWTIYQSELVKHFSDGKDSISSAIKELEEHGYIIKEKAKGEKGRFSGYNFIIIEEPDRSGFSAAETPKSEIPPLLNTNNNQILNKPNSTSVSEKLDIPSKSELESDTTSSDKSKTEVKKFKQSDYRECVSMITKCQNTLRSMNKQIDETQFPIPVMNKWLKKWFAEYGVEQTKQGIMNSVHFGYLVNNGYKLTVLFSDKIFPQCVSKSFAVDYSNNLVNIRKGQTAFVDKERKYSEEGRF